MFKSLNNIIENDVKFSNLDFYSVIIGKNPSKGARSPQLWNKVYTSEEKKIRMVPLDVKEENIEHLFNYLSNDQHCLGGAVAVPYKERIFNFIKKNLREEVKDIGAVNCFYRSPSSPLINEFTGTNTDGEAALEPIREYLEKSEDLAIGLIGFGGAGKAILAFLLKDFKNRHRIHLFNRSVKKINNVKKIGVAVYSLRSLGSHLPQLDLLINATSVGHAGDIDATPIPTRLLSKAKKTMLVYDIIYDPIKTTLLKNSERMGLRTINGLHMNLIQAVLAYSYTNSTSLSIADIYKIMN
ncbi:MAG: hypothetical protein CML36_04970 [Rhodobacteraceae bacterium]|nr:hypothetical protein [Paracoccaceae bacterium]